MLHITSARGLTAGRDYVLAALRPFDVAQASPIKAGRNIGGLSCGLYWAREAYRDPALGIPSTDPAPPEAIALGRELVEKARLSGGDEGEA